MSFDTYKIALNGRFAEVVSHLNYITSFEPKEPQMEPSLEMKMFRGFFYVHMYAVLERAINDLVSELVMEIKNNSPQNCHLIHPLNVLTQARYWQSLRDSRHSEINSKAVQILDNIDSAAVLEFEPVHILKNLNNIWTNTIIELLNLFGISGFEISPTDRTLIDEIAEKRNAVAHGRESPAAVGERFRCEALRNKLQRLQTFCNALVSHVETYCLNYEFIRTINRNKYSKTKPFAAKPSMA